MATASLAEQSAFLEAFKSALGILQDSKLKIPRPPAQIVRRDVSFGTLLEQYCASQKDLNCTLGVGDGRNKFIYHVTAEFFRVDFRINDQVVADASIIYDWKSAPDQACPELALALRCRNMFAFNQSMRGFLDMFPPAKDKAQRLQMFMCLDSLDKDLRTIFLHSERSGLKPTDLVHASSFGLICPRREGLPSRLGFFLAPRTLIRDGKIMKDLSYCSIAAQQLGLWVSIVVKEAPQSSILASSSLLKKNVDLTAADCENYSAFVDVAEAGPVEVYGCFRMVFAKTFPVFESAFREIHRLTGIKPNIVPELSGRKIWECFTDGKTSESGDFYVTLPGHHHCYHLDASMPLAEAIVDIPFAFVTQIPALIRLLRKQALFNELFSSCVRLTPADGVVNPFQFYVSVTQFDSILIDFSHPLTSAASRLEITYANPLLLTCRAVDCQPPLVTDEMATIFLRRTMSISVMLKSAIDSFVQNYVPNAPPSPPKPPVVEMPSESPPIRSDSVVEIPLIPDQSPSSSASMPSTPDIIQLPLTPQTPGTPSSSQIISPPRFAKIEAMLAGSKHAKFPTFIKNVPAFGLDSTDYTEKMKELYTKPAIVVKTEKSAEEPGGAKIKIKKRKLSADMGISAPANPVVNESVAKYSALLRTSSEESPHGSPLTVKFSKQPVSGDAAGSGSAKEGPSMPKKKKLKTIELIPNAPAIARTSEGKKAFKPSSSELESLLRKKRTTAPLGPPKAVTSKAPSLASVLNAPSKVGPNPNRTSPGTPRTPNSKLSPALKSKAGVVSPAKSPTTAPTAPVFSMPKTPSISALPRIPKKGAVPALHPPFVATILSPADFEAVNQITTLIANVAPPRAPLLPTPLPSYSPKTLSVDNPAVVLTPFSDAMSANMVELTRSFDEDVKKAAELSASEAVQTTTGKTRNRSISAVLDRLKSQKSRVESSENSLDATDVQDAVFKQPADINESILVGVESIPVPGPAPAEDEIKPGLVPYSEDDSSEEDFLKTNVEAAQNEIRLTQQSPEFLEPTSLLAHFAVPETVNIPENGLPLSEGETANSTRPSLPSPKIDDALFDAAFFTTDEND